jgi:ribosomal protein L23
MILQKLKSTEKIVKMIEAENTLMFETDRAVCKDDVKKEVEKMFNVEVAGVRTLNRSNKKFAYVKLKENFSAADVATKLGML